MDCYDSCATSLIELGWDFCVVGSEFPLQVSGRDFALDLVFFHRGLNCLVAIELKVGRFEPECLGKLSFCLEARDRDVKKAHENPAIGVLAGKDDEVVEYALSCSLSPALIAENHTQLADKQLLQQKLHEVYQQKNADTQSFCTDRRCGASPGTASAPASVRSSSLITTVPAFQPISAYPATRTQGTDAPPPEARLRAPCPGFLKETAAASLTDPTSSLMLQRRQLPRGVRSTKTAGFDLLQTCNQQPGRFAALRCSRVNGGALSFLEETGHGAQAAKQEPLQHLRACRLAPTP